MLKRSIINKSIEVAKEVFSRSGLRLPEFASWTCDDWLKVGTEADEIRNCMLGWDVTDFGSGDFKNIGRTLFTLRNGRHGDIRYPKSYAEKFILDPEGQRAPAHFHKSKREDIINRGTGIIVLELTKSDNDGQPASGSLTVAIDGISKSIASGDRVKLKPGQSICIHPGTIHQFWGEGGNGFLIDGVMYGVSGEVSSVCDDRNDNVFIAGKSCRFPKIDEDEVSRHFLCQEYPKS
jgi:hypothetical protein